MDLVLCILYFMWSHGCEIDPVVLRPDVVQGDQTCL